MVAYIPASRARPSSCKSAAVGGCDSKARSFGLPTRLGREYAPESDPRECRGSHRRRGRPGRVGTGNPAAARCASDRAFGVCRAETRVIFPLRFVVAHQEQKIRAAQAMLPGTLQRTCWTPVSRTPRCAAYPPRPSAVPSAPQLPTASQSNFFSTAWMLPLDSISRARTTTIILPRSSWLRLNRDEKGVGDNKRGRKKGPGVFDSPGPQKRKTPDPFVRPLCVPDVGAMAARYSSASVLPFALTGLSFGAFSERTGFGGGVDRG